MIQLIAPTCSIRYAGNDPKRMDRDVRICGAVIASSPVCEEWPWFSHSRGVVGEAQSGTFEPAMTEPDSLYSKEPVIRIVDTTKLFCGDEP